MNVTLFFVANDGVHGKELWKSDGTSNGTVLVKDINTDPNLATDPFFSDFVSHNGVLYFAARDTTNGIELWRSDGTDAGTVMIDLRPGAVASSPAGIITADGSLFFEGGDPNSPLGWAFYKSDGTQAGTHAVTNHMFAESTAAIAATQGADTLTGTPFADIIDGLRGNDTLIGLGGNDLLRGGLGDDTAVFSQNLGSYTVQDFGSKIVVTGPDGTATLTGIEHLAFANGMLNVADDGNPLFDTLYYLSRNPDVFQAGIDPLFHYNVIGFHEGRDPNAWFDTSGYLAVNKDVAAAGVNPLNHYHNSGWHEGRDPSAKFDTTLYLLRNPDVAAAGIDPLAHYLAAGQAEGRQAYAAVGSAANGFDAQYYLFHNPDVAAAGIDPLLHYNVVGWHEGRDPSAWFDTSGYLSHYTDVAAAGANPLFHYEVVGWTEGRDPSAGFDTLGYLAANPDVAAAHVNPLDHFLTFGIYEGRQAVNDGLFH